MKFLDADPGTDRNLRDVDNPQLKKLEGLVQIAN